MAKIESVIDSAKPIRTFVGAGQTKDVDTTDVAGFNGLRYFIAAWGNSRSKSMDMLVNRDDGDVNDQVFGRAGALPMSINAVESGGNVLIRVMNPNAFQIDIELLKFVLGA